jgi:hypothetical protein
MHSDTPWAQHIRSHAASSSQSTARVFRDHFKLRGGKSACQFFGPAFPGRLCPVLEKVPRDLKVAPKRFSLLDGGSRTQNRTPKRTSVP